MGRQRGSTRREFLLGAMLASGGSALRRAANAASADYVRTLARYDVPDVTLTDMNGQTMNIRAALRNRGPVILQFMYATCSGICPISSALLADVQSSLSQEQADLRLWSVSIDPEADTPERLRLYAMALDAGPNWRFLTGRLDDIVALQEAFDAYRGNKMRHELLIFIRIQSDHWVRLNGLVSASELAAEFRRAVRS